MATESMWHPLAKNYDPVKCGNIDGSSLDVHDKAICRALNSTYRPNKGVTGDEKCTIFVGRLSLKTDEESLRGAFARYGTINKIRVVRDLVTGYSKGYAFIEYSDIAEAKLAHKHTHETVLDGSTLLVEFEFERTMVGWIPRRLGGGFGGKKEAGQLRFGGRDRPFRKPYFDQQHSEPRSRQHDAVSRDRDKRFDRRHCSRDDNRSKHYERYRSSRR